VKWKDDVFGLQLHIGVPEKLICGPENILSVL
jgi:hypothetical protein